MFSRVLAYLVQLKPAIISLTMFNFFLCVSLRNLLISLNKFIDILHVQIVSCCERSSRLHLVIQVQISVITH